MIRIVLFLLCFPLQALALGLPEPLSDTVSDYADLLDADQEARLSNTLKAARDETGVHIVVVTMGSIKTFGGLEQSIETYSKLLFNTWGIGDAARNDGIMILVAKGDREIRIALGAGYDAVYDGLAQRVIDREMLPAFRQDRYAAGIEAGTLATIDRLARPFATHTPPAPIAEPSQLPTYGLFGLGSLGMLLFAFRRNIGNMISRFRACPSCGQKGLSRVHTVQITATELRSGEGTEITRCKFCNYEHRESYTIPQISRSRNGFGGGRSSGGGASGRW